jgi:hypothetical protein
MDTISSKPKVGHAVVHPDLPTTAGYVPIVVGPGTGAGHGHGRGSKAQITGNPITMTVQVWSGDTGFNGTVNLDVQFYGLTEDSSGNISLVDNITQIPEHNGNGGNNRKQTIQLNGQSKTTVNIYVVPDSNEVEAMMLVRPQGASTGNVGVYFFTII